MSSNLRAFFFAACVAAGAAACGGGPSAPSATPGAGLPFQSTRYSLDFLGDSTRCGDVKSPQAGTMVSFFANMQLDGTGWFAAAQDGTFTIRFQQGTASVPSGRIAIAGTAKGSAGDHSDAVYQIPNFPATGTTLTVTDQIPITGSANRDFGTGTLDGPVTFSRNGVSSTCPAGAVGWTLNRQ